MVNIILGWDDDFKILVYLWILLNDYGRDRKILGINFYIEVVRFNFVEKKLKVFLNFVSVIKWNDLF